MTKCILGKDFSFSCVPFGILKRKRRKDFSQRAQRINDVIVGNDPQSLVRRFALGDSSFRYAPFGMTAIYVNKGVAAAAATPPLLPLPLFIEHVVIPNVVRNLLLNRGCMKKPCLRHCERSEAIQKADYHWIASVANQARNDRRPRNDGRPHNDVIAGNDPQSPVRRFASGDSCFRRNDGVTLCAPCAFPPSGEPNFAVKNSRLLDIESNNK